MGKKDTVSKKIERNNDVFADIFNTLLFKKEVIQSQKLKPGVTNVLVETKKGDKSLGLENQTEKDFKTQVNPKFEVYKDKKGEFRFRLKAKNGQIIATSEGYSKIDSCLKGVASVQKNAKDAKIAEK